MDPTNTLPDFAFLDPKILASLIGWLLIWVQFWKDHIKDELIKSFSLASALVFIFLVDSCIGNGCSKIIPPWIAKPIIYAAIAAPAAGLGFKMMTSKAAKDGGAT